MYSVHTQLERCIHGTWKLGFYIINGLSSRVQMRGEFKSAPPPSRCADVANEHSHKLALAIGPGRPEP